jgi:hypothetical protein
MTDRIHIPQEDLVLYGMHALPSAEVATIREHLSECADCRAELAQISGDLALAAMSAPQHPLPQGARDRFLERIGAQPEHAKNVVNIADTPSGSKPRIRRAPLWIPWSAAAALLVIAIALGIQLQNTRRELEHQTAIASAQTAESNRAREVMEVLNAPSAQHILLTAGTPRPVPTARAVYLSSRGALVLEASNLAPIDADKTYELWIIPANGKAPIPAGLFRPDATGSASLVLPQIPVGVEAKALGITIEKASGSAAPTPPIVLAGAVPAPGQ